MQDTQRTPRASKEYEYDVFLSWTGCDRAVKDQLCNYLTACNLRVYDSDKECRGEYRSNYAMALSKSKVYVLILSDGLIANFNSEVKREITIANEYEAKGELNVTALCLSDKFKYLSTPRYDEYMHWFLYSNTRGYSFNYADIDDGGLLSDGVLFKVGEDCNYFIGKRDRGEPVISQAPLIRLEDYNDLDIDYTESNFFGRKREIAAVEGKFSSGAKVVVLHGMGGIGKTQLAGHIAKTLNSQKTLHYVQTVSVQESDRCRDGDMEKWVGEVLPKASFRYELNKTSDIREKYQMRLSALRELPEYCLIVLDNFNYLDCRAINFIRQNIKCRVIITTRKSLDERDFEGDEGVAFVDLGKMDKPEAYDMFVKTSRAQVTPKQFEKVYQLVDGHTYALRIIAKIVSAQQDIGIDAVVEDIKSGMSKDEVSTDRDDGSIYEIFSRLYDVSNLDGTCVDILLNMSLLADGTIEEKYLCEYMQLPNKNHINRLVGSCWLIRDGRLVKLHPMISQTIFVNRRPSQDECRPIIKYLVDISGVDKEYSIKSIHTVADMLFFALDRLASADGRLCVELWKKFEDVNFLLGDVADITSKVEQLDCKVQDDCQKSFLTAYRSKAMLELRPVEYLDDARQMMSALSTDSEDYKRVLSYLSITTLHVGANPEYREALLDLLSKVFAIASEKKDDLAVLNLIVYMAVADIDCARKSASKYIKSRKADGADNGTLQYISVLATSLKMLSGESFNRYGDMLGQAARNNYKPLIRMVLRHPIAAVKQGIGINKWKNLPDSDEMKYVLMSIKDVANKLADENVIDVPTYFDAMKRLYMLNYQNGFTRQNISNIVKSFVELIKGLPPQMQGELSKIASIKISLSDCEEEINVESLATLDAAMEINYQLRNRLAIEQSRTLVEVNNKYYPSCHPKVVAATLQYANVQTLFGEYDGATETYLRVYEALKDNIKESLQLAEVCNSLLRIGFGTLTAVKMSEIRDVALGICKSKDWNKFCIYEYYVVALIKKCKEVIRIATKEKRKMEIPLREFDAAFKDFLDCCKDIAAYPNDCKVNIVAEYRETCIQLCNSLSTMFRSDVKSKYVDEMLNTYDVMYDSASGLIKQYVSICRDEMTGFRGLYCMDGYRTDNCFDNASAKAIYSAINKCVKLSVNFAGALGNCSKWYIKSKYHEYVNNADGLRLFLDDTVGKRGKIRKFIDGYISAVKETSQDSQAVDGKIMQYINDYRIEIANSDIRKAKNARALFARIFKQAFTELLQHGLDTVDSK